MNILTFLPNLKILNIFLIFNNSKESIGSRSTHQCLYLFLEQMTAKSNFGVTTIAKHGKSTLVVDTTTMFLVLYFIQKLNLFFQILKTKVFESGICRRERVFRLLNVYYFSIKYLHFLFLYLNVFCEVKYRYMNGKIFVLFFYIFKHN